MRSILEVGSEQLPAFIIGKEKVWDIMKWKYHRNMCFISAIQKDVLIKTKSIAPPAAKSIRSPGTFYVSRETFPEIA